MTCETNTGEVYRGRLVEAEDNMNCQMTAVTVTFRDGRVAQLENIYIRGSKIRSVHCCGNLALSSLTFSPFRFLILPDMLKNAPMFKTMGRGGRGASNTGSAGRGKSAILRAQAARGRGRGGPGGPPRGGGGRGGPWPPRGR